jgi:hypothetical protein
MCHGCTAASDVGSVRPMHGTLRVAITLFAIAGGCFAASVAWAQTAQPYRLEYSGSLRCQRKDDFLWQLEARTHSLRPARKGETAPTLQVSVSDDRERIQGLVALREPDGRSTVRRVSGVNCEEVVAALALVAAVMVDPDASTEPVIRPREPASPAAPRSATGRLNPWRLGISGGAAVQTGAAPKRLVGPTVEASALAPRGALFAVSLHYGRSDWFRVSTEDASLSGWAILSWTSARLYGCPMRWPARSPVALRPCATLDVGVLQGEGTGEYVHNGSSRTVPWTALGVAGRWELEVMRWLVLEADAGPSASIWYSEFWFGPRGDRVSVYKVPPLSLSASVRAGLRFP